MSASYGEENGTDGSGADRRLQPPAGRSTRAVRGGVAGGSFASGAAVPSALGKFRGVEWVGISLDEATRAKDSRYGWISTRWPLLERRMRRRDCERWLRARGFSVPKKSACLFCPWRSAAEYARWREEEPELFEAACAVDVRIRASGRGMRGVKTSQYVTRLLIPLRDLPPYEELRATREDDAQIDLFENECEGHCGV